MYIENTYAKIDYTYIWHMWEKQREQSFKYVFLLNCLIRDISLQKLKVKGF